LRSIWLRARLGHRAAILRCRNVNAVPYRRRRGIEKAGVHRVTLSTPPERTPTGGVGWRCKRSRNRVRLSERVLGSINPPSAGPRAVRRGRGSLERLNLIGTVRFPLSKAIECPESVGRLSFIRGNHRGNGKPLKQLELLSR